MKKIIIASKSSPLARGVAGGTRRGVAKKFIVAIMCVLGITTAYAETSEITTSQHYVDTNAATKQDAVPANNANTVMTYDSTADSGIGTKAIYNESSTYETQKNALVSAATANAAIQNGINSEFTCANPPKCNLWNMAGIYQQNNPTPHASGKNLLDPSFMDNSTYDTVTVYGVTTNYAKILPTENGKQYTLSASLIGNKDFYYYLLGIKPDGTLIGTYGFDGTCDGWLWNTNGHPEYVHQLLNVSCNFMAQDNVVYIVYFPGKSYTSRLTITNYQMEEGDTATAYEPYQNLYIPQNVQ